MKNIGFACKEITKRDFNDWVKMAAKLWPTHSQKEIYADFWRILTAKKEICFICRGADGSPAGFAEVSIRADYVPGAGASPVGFLEAIFVESKYRRLGLGKKLLRVAEKWALKNGCKEIGSDAGLKNLKSQRFHKAIGFKETERTVAYIKKIKN